MGITGLLPFVKNACRKGNIGELRGKSVAVDVSCLLHRGLTGCMDKIHMGEATESYIGYVAKYVDNLVELDCHVVMVFDGRPLPAKKGTNDDRRELREKRKEHAELLLAKGLEREARDYLRLATTISAEIVEKTIEKFRKCGKTVDILVAPYEADAQLAYLMTSGLVDAVITEDSDLIVFGCEMIYFKWQAGSGECQVYEKSNLKNCFTGELGGAKFDFVKFRRICILAGCDYLPSGLPGVGLSTAAKFFSLTSISDLKILLRKVPVYLKNSKLKEHITPEFIRNFENAENTFKHQIVFDPRERCQKPLSPYPEMDEIESLESPVKNSSAPPPTSSKFAYAGTTVTQRTAIRLALGNQENSNPIDDRFLLFQPTPDWSVWDFRYESKGKIREMVQKQKELEARQCGGAFKLSSPSAKRVKLDKSAAIAPENEIIREFMESIEKEKSEMRKRKNAANSDYNPEILIKKYAGPTEPKKSTILIEDDDFSELFDEKSAKLENSAKKSAISTEKSAKQENSTEKSIKSAKINISMEKSTKSTNSSNPTEKSAKSRYFAKNSNSDSPKTSNPFRCPAFVKSTPKIEELPKKSSLLADLDVEEPKTVSTPDFRFVGFKSAGLRRKSKF